MSWKYHAIEAMRYLPLLFVAIAGWYFFLMFKSAETLHWLFSQMHELRRKTANTVIFFAFFIPQFAGMLALIKDVTVWQNWDSTIAMIVIGFSGVIVSALVAITVLGYGHNIAERVDKQISEVKLRACRD